MKKKSFNPFRVLKMYICRCFFLVLPHYCHLQGSGEQAVGMKHFEEALKLVRPSCLRSSLGRTELSPTSWEQIGGLEEVKLKLRQVNAFQCLNYIKYKEL